MFYRSNRELLAQLVCPGVFSVLAKSSICAGALGWLGDKMIFLTVGDGGVKQGIDLKMFTASAESAGSLLLMLMIQALWQCETGR
eukprot:7106903-Ditylum_brightwellii.AAC.1